MKVLLLILCIIGVTRVSAMDLKAPDSIACLTGLDDHTRLAIGVLGVDKSGELVIGISPYAGSLHSHIVDRLKEDRDIGGILWMGEMRYRRRGDGKVEIVQANETSGFFGTVRRGELSPSIPIANDARNLPASIRAEEFHPIHFDPKHLRLAFELEDLGDVRHSINNTLTIIGAPAQMLFSKRAWDERKNIMLTEFRRTARDHLALLRWVILNLVEDDRLKVSEISQILPFLSTLGDVDAPVENFASIDGVELQAQLARIARLVNPTNSEMKVDIFSLPQ